MKIEDLWCHCMPMNTSQNTDRDAAEAATVILTRERAGSVQVYLLQRSPEEGLAGNLEGKIPLSPPTLVTLHELLKYPHINDLQTESRHRPWGQAILPRLVPLAKGAVIVEPWDPLYREKELRIAPDPLPSLILPVGEPFSRIWYDGRLWRPIGA